MRRALVLTTNLLLLVTLMLTGASPAPATAPSNVPTGLLADMAGNDVIEPGEIVGLAPIWTNVSGAPFDITGTIGDFTGPLGASYDILNDSADYGNVTNGETASCWFEPQLDCYLLQVSDPAVRPAKHWHATVEETLSTGEIKTWTLHIGRSFADVSPTSGFYPFIETLLHNGVTAGCNNKTPPWYCPKQLVTREQMAVFLLRADEGASYTPPPPGSQIFADVPPSHPYAAWINELYRRGVTAGCATNPRRYCPADPVTREQMAVFLLRALEGSSYNPPPAGSQIFTDVPPQNTYAKWIHEIYDRGITAGCDSNPPRYCPSSSVTREQMAIFLVRTFDLLLYHP